MKRVIPLVLCGLSLAAATTWANGQGEPTTQDDATQVQQLNQQVQTLRQAAGLTPISGPGVVLELQDKPRKSQKSTPIAIVGIVHDYDILQVVNELRAANAEAIAINGVRLTNYTPVRCVGPTILVDGQPIGLPVKVEAVGNPDSLHRALSVKGGLLTYFQQSGPDVRLSRAAKLHLPAASNTPFFSFGKPE